MQNKAKKVLKEIFGFSELKKVAGRNSFKFVKKKDVLDIIEAGSLKVLNKK